MCAVKGICERPTALGTIPPEYLPSRHYVDGPDAVVPEGAIIRKVNRKRGADRDDATTTSHPTDWYYNLPATHREACPFYNLPVHPEEMNAFTSPRLAVTSFTVAQTPPVRSHTRDVEIVFTGRSNVGKSSLLNALTESEIAESSQKPGKTQSLNFFALSASALKSRAEACHTLAYASPVDPYKQNQFLDNLLWGLDEPMSAKQKATYSDVVANHANGPVLYLVDVPGYGFAKAPKPVVDRWNALIGGYVRLRSPVRFPLEPEFRARYDEVVENAARRAKEDDAAPAAAKRAEPTMEDIARSLKGTGVKLGEVTPHMLLRLGVSEPTRMLQQLRQSGVKLDDDGAASSDDKQTAATPVIYEQPPPPTLNEDTSGSPLKLVVVLIDPKIGLQRQDIAFMDFMEAFEIPYQVVITKADRVKGDALEGVALSIAQSLFPHAYLHVYSGKTKEEVDSILQPRVSPKKLNDQMYKNDTEEFATPVEQLSANAEAAWVRAQKSQPRRFCSPLLFAVSSRDRRNLSSFKKMLLNAAYHHLPQ
jgi:GTP-binding protein EngB required for normal cell division